MKRKRLITTAAGTLVAAAIAGVAWASIPGPGNVYTACMLKGLGTIRLIDTSLPAGSLMSRCTDKEIQISWNQAGVPGPAGTQGAAGAAGADGLSVASAVEPAGANCANGGSRFTASNGVTFACNGRDGTGGSGSLDSLQGSPCNNSAGTTQVSYGSNGSVSLKCLVTTTLTVATTSTLGAGGTVTSSPAGISCPGTCTGSFEVGTNVSLIATPSGSDAFAGWSGDCTGLAGCSLTMSEARNVTADFAPGNTFHLHMTRTPNCQITPVGLRCNDEVITTSPGDFTCKLGPSAPTVGILPAAKDCTWTFVRGTTVTLTSAGLLPLGESGATPTWSGACASATGKTCQVTVDANIDVGAAYP